MNTDAHELGFVSIRVHPWTKIVAAKNPEQRNHPGSDCKKYRRGYSNLRT